MKKILTLLMITLLVALSVVPVFADDPTTPPEAGEDSKYKEVNGENEVKFNKYLISEEGQDLSDLGYTIEFTYEVSQGDAIGADPDDGIFEVKQGPLPKGDDKITVTTATFTNDSPDKNSTVQDGDIITLDAGKVYQKQEVTIDFSKVEFTEPGIYRYVLTEKKIDGATGISYDTQKGSEATEMVRIVDVYVVDTEETGDGTPKLKIGDTVIHEVATTVKTTNENGSKDEKATIANKWGIIGVPEPYATDPGVQAGGYSTKDEAETARKKIREKIHDDILAVSDSINDSSTGLAKAVADAQKALDDAEADPDVRDAQQAYDTAHAAAESLRAQIKEAQGKLATTTEPDKIREYRATIDNLRPQLTTAETEESDKLGVLNHAKDDADVPGKEAALETAKAKLQEAKDKLQELQALWDTLEADDCIVVVGWKLEDKSDGYVNEVDPVYDLHFSKEVKGNQGSRDKYFAFTLNIKGLEPNQIVDVTGNFTKEVTEEGLKNTATKYSHTVINTANSRDDVPDTDKWMFLDGDGNHVTRNNQGGYFTGDPDGDGYFDSEEAATSLNSSYGNRYTVVKVTGRTGQQLKADSSGNITWTVYLKHGEYIDVLNLKKGAKYTLTEDAEDYKSEEKTNIEVGKVEVGAAKWYVIATPGTDLTNTDFGSDLSGYYTDSQKNAYTSEGLNSGTYDWFVGWGELQGTPGQACTDPASGTMTKNIYTGFTNTKNGIIPTGVLMSATGGVALIIIAIAALVILNRRRAEDEE